jgi:hypothetical protein
MSDPPPQPPTRGTGLRAGRARGRCASVIGQAPTTPTTPTGPLSQLSLGAEGPTGIPGPSTTITSAVPDPKEGDSERVTKDKERFERFLSSRDYLKTRPDSLESKKGTGGTVVSLASNFFEVQLKVMKDWRLRQFRVDINPDIDDNRMRKTIIWKLMHSLPENPPYLFDGGSMMFSIKDFEADPFIASAEYDNKDGTKKSYEVCIKYTNSLNWSHVI